VEVGQDTRVRLLRERGVRAYYRGLVLVWVFTVILICELLIIADDFPSFFIKIMHVNVVI